MQKAIKLENISNLIASPSSYQCRKTRLVHFIIHGRNTSMERMCAQEKLATYGTQEQEEKTQHNMRWTSLSGNKSQIT
jgi:hypothetical protein